MSGLKGINMKQIGIKEKLVELGMPVETMNLGDFDYIGEFTAKKSRPRDSELYKSTGCFFRPNYERGLLATAMVRRYKPKRILEIGFGRGYWSTCVAKAAHDLNLQTEIISVDVKFNKEHIEMMSNMFPSEWLQHIKMIEGKSAEIIPTIEGDFDIVYIDGDHMFDAVQADWLAVKDRFKQFVIFDDYHLPSAKSQAEIQVARAVDEIDKEYLKEVVIMDREIFADDRTLQEKDYGQVILRSPMFVEPVNPYDYNW